jgi:hypothetical protein
MSSKTEKALDNYNYFAYARDHGHLDFVEKATRCDNYFIGQQWDEAVVARLARLGKPILTINKVLSTCATIFGEQLSNRADIRFRPAHNGSAETANALDKVWLHVSETNNLDFLESEMAADGFIRSRGFLDVRMNFDDQLRGEVRIKHLNSKNVVIDPDASSYDPDEWKEVFVTKWLTFNDIERLYGRSFAQELRNRPHTGYAFAYDSLDWLPDSFGGPTNWGVSEEEDNDRRRILRVIERQYRDLRYIDLYVDPQTGDTREVPTTWDRERVQMVAQRFGWLIIKRRVEQIRWTTSVNDVLLHDDWSPYQHFTPVPYFPYFRHGTTVGVVENLISPQDLLNKSMSQELHIVGQTANSGWKVKSGALANMTPEQLEERGGEDGLVIETNTSPKDIEKIQPNQIPSGMDRLSFKADESLKEVSMISDSMRGFDREDVAAKAIQAKQMRGSISLAKPFDNLAFTRKLLARNVLSLVQTFYDEHRIINITGRNLADEPEELEVNKPLPEGVVANDLTVGEYAIVVSTVPSRDNYEQSQFQEALEMRQLGIAIPDDVLVEHSHLGRKTEIAKRIKQLNGGGEPSQTQQQLEQLDLQLKQLEAEEKKADVQVKMSNAQLNAARAQKEQLEQQQDDNGHEAEMLKAAMERERAMVELATEKQKIAEELKLKREETEAEIEMAWAKLRAEMALEREKLNSQIAQNEAKIEAEQQKNELQAEVTMKKADQDAELAERKAQLQEKQPKQAEQASAKKKETSQK